MSRRLARLNEQLKREISAIVRTSVRDPRVGRPTVTDVRTAADLSLARVYVRPDPTGAAGENPIEGLETAAPFIRRELGKVLDLRRVPELRFEVDRTYEDARRIERILGEVRASEGWGEAEDAGDARDGEGDDERDHRRGESATDPAAGEDADG